MNLNDYKNRKREFRVLVKENDYYGKILEYAGENKQYITLLKLDGNAISFRKSDLQEVYPLETNGIQIGQGDVLVDKYAEYLVFDCHLSFGVWKLGTAFNSDFNDSVNLDKGLLKNFTLKPLYQPKKEPMFSTYHAIQDFDIAYQAARAALEDRG